MGTFGCYSGSMCIPENRKEEFIENILKLLNYGGMMPISFPGKLAGGNFVM